MFVHNLRKVMKIPSQGFERGECICNPLVLFLLLYALKYFIMEMVCSSGLDRLKYRRAHRHLEQTFSSISSDPV